MSLDDVKLSRAIRGTGAALHREISRRQRVKMHKGKVLAANDDGSVDIVIPPYPDPNDGTGDLYTGIHTLASYLPAVNDNVLFIETGPARYVCLGKSVGASGGGQGGQASQGENPQPATQHTDQIALTIRSGETQSMPWFARTDAVMTVTGFRVAVVSAQPLPIDLILRTASSVVEACELPPFLTTVTGTVDPAAEISGDGGVYVAMASGTAPVEVLVLLDVEYP